MGVFSARARDKFYVVYFIIHIAVTLLIDAAIALPESLWLPIQRTLLALHVKYNHDVLVINRPVWLQAFIWIELLLQTPFFAWAAWDLSRGRTRVYPAVLVYGVEAAVTTYACLAEAAFAPELPLAGRLQLVGVYVPYFLIPLAMAIDFYRRLAAALRRDPVAKKGN